MQIERLCMEHRQLTVEIAALTGRKDAFYRENRAVLDTPAPAVGSDADLRGALPRGKRAGAEAAGDLVPPDRSDRGHSGADRPNQPPAGGAGHGAGKPFGSAQCGGIPRKSQGSPFHALHGRDSERLSEAVDRLGKATGLQAVMDSQLTVSVRDGGATRAITTASRGTRDLLRFCARLALTEALTADGEKPFSFWTTPSSTLTMPICGRRSPICGMSGKTRRFSISSATRAGQDSRNGAHHDTESLL